MTKLVTFQVSYGEECIGHIDEPLQSREPYLCERAIALLQQYRPNTQMNDIGLVLVNDSNHHITIRKPTS